MPLRLTGGLSDGLERALDLRREQHLLSAANLANAETPGYLARAVPFDDLLAASVTAAERGEAGPDLTLRTFAPAPGGLDGNSVDAEAEAVRLTENQVLYNALTTGLSHHLGLLRFAAGDGRA